MSNESYTSSDVLALGDTEAIRMRSGMYIGSTENPIQLFIEAIDNALDEVQSGYSDKAIVKVDTKSNLYSVRDYGRGIPIGKSKYVDIIGTEHDIETIQLLYTKSHSGGKFGSKAYKKSMGLHGIGLKCINALSNYTKAVTYRDGKSVELIMSKGKVQSLEYKDSTEPNGVYVEFTPDESIFSTPIIPMSKIIEVCSIPNAFGSKIELYEDGQPVELLYKDIFDMIPKFDGEHELLKTSFYVENQTSKESIKVALTYTSGTNNVYRGYTNMIYNSSGGSHVRFFESCYIEAWKKYLDDEFSIWDVLIGLRALIGVSINNDVMAFSSQTKERLTTDKKYFDQFKDDLIKQIQDYFDKNESERLGLIKRFKEYRAAQNKLLASKDLSKMIYVNNDPNTVNNGSVRRKSVIAKLIECTSKTRQDTELIICEGNSAAGTLVQARDVKYDAILPIRGKILNVSNIGSFVECMKNEEVKSIVNSAGTGIGPDCDHNKSRYDRYLIFADSDPDGYNISALLISIFVNLLPDLVKNDMVYVVVSPLYGWTDNGKRYYSNDIKEVTNKSTMTRYKGLGEMDAINMKESCLDRNAQKLIQVEFPNDINKFNESMTSAETRYKILDSMGLILHKNIL